MCQPKSKGGQRCSSHAKSALQRAIRNKKDYEAERERLRERLREMPKEELPEDASRLFSNLNQKIQEAEDIIQEKRLDWAATTAGQGELREKIKEAEEISDFPTAKSLEKYAEKAVARQNIITKRNIEKYSWETRTKNLRENYLPPVYSQYAGATSSKVPEYLTAEDIEKERQRLESDTDTSPEEVRRQVDLMERSQSFYAKWTSRNFGDDKVTFQDYLDASHAKDVAEEDHGVGSSQAIAAARHANLVEKVYKHGRKSAYEDTMNYLQSEEASKELERQQEAIHQGVVLQDAVFQNDMERQTSPHGVTRQDLGRAGMVTEKAKAVYGKSSEQYKIAAKREERVQQAWQTRRAMISQSRRMRLLGKIQGVSGNIREHFPART